MRRRYTPELFLKWARRWREIAPDGGLTTDIIVGFPGETEAEFEDSMRIARQAQFSAIHVFPYSPREGTVAAELPGFVAPEIQKQRVAKLLKLADELGRNFAMRFMGKPLPVLVEKTESDFAEGLTENYLKARVQLNGKTFRAGDVIFARAENWNAGIVETRLIAS
jgi:threonylcarbamoyladenosine tRNA methylthiotransferase MtaB